MEKVQGQDFINKLHQRLFTLEDSGVDSTTYAYWRRNKLINFVQEGQWARFSYEQVIWLKILSTLKDFGCKLDMLQKIHSHFFEKAYKDNIAEKYLKGNEIYLSKKEKAKTISVSEKELLDYIRDILADPVWVYFFRVKVSYLSNLIIYCIESGEETGFYISPKGEIIEYKLGKLTGKSGDIANINFPHIYIPIKPYLASFIEDEKIEQYLGPLGLLTDEELQVITAIRNKNVKELTIKLKDGKVTRIDASKAGVIKEEKAKEIRKILGLGNYESVTIETMNETTLAFKQTRKMINKK